MSFLSSAVYIAEAAIGIGLIIFLHEAGHFMIARWCGVRVETFSLGFGPRLFGWKRGDTDYRVSLVPFGGYVKMAGENAAMSGTGAPDEFPSKTVGQRALIASGGVIMNIITAAVFFILAFTLGVKFVVPEVGTATPGTVARSIGLQEGDRLVSFQGEPIRYFRQLSMAIAFSDPEEEVELVVERMGPDGPTRIPLRFKPAKSKSLGAPVLDGLAAPISSVLRSVAADQPAGKARLAKDGSPFPIRKGDMITSIAGRPVGPYDGSRILRALKDNPGETIPVTIRRGAVALTKKDDRDRPVLHYEGGEAFELLLDVGSVPRATIGAYPADHPVVEEGIGPDSAAFGKLQPGDVLLEVNGVDSRRAHVWDETRYSRGKTLSLLVRRGEEELPVELQPRFIRSDYFLGLRPVSSRTVGSVDPGSPAERAGLKPGDFIEKVDDQDFLKEESDGSKSDWGAWFNLDSYFAGTQKRKLVVRRGEERIKMAIVPVLPETTDLVEGSAGIGLGPPYFSLRSSGLADATKLGIQGTIGWVGKVFLTIKSLASRDVHPKNLGGIVMIAESSYQFASMGFGTILYFLGIISVNLAILNVLPIPVLDGGLLLFLLLEKLKGKPVEEKWMVIANYVGLAMLLTLMVYVTHNDIVRILDRSG